MYLFPLRLDVLLTISACHPTSPAFAIELELKSVRARLARLHGEAEMEPTAERQGQINALMYKLKTLQREVKREC